MEYLAVFSGGLAAASSFDDIKAPRGHLIILDLINSSKYEWALPLFFLVGVGLQAWAVIWCISWVYKGSS